MSECKEIKLIDLCTFQRGHDLPKTEMKEGLYPVAGSNSVIGFHNKYTTKGPSLTIGRSGNIGTPYYYSCDFWAHNTVLYVKDFHGNNPKFVYYLLKTIDFSQYNVGSAVPTLNRNHIHEHEITSPPLPEQERIAEVLSSLDDKIDLLHRNNKTLEQLAETLFRQWFVEEAEDSWEDAKLGQFIVPRKGKNITKSEAIDGIYPVVAGGLEPSCFHNQSNTKAPVITISSSGANAGFVKLYYTEVWSSDSSFIDETVTDYVYFFYVMLRIKQSQIFDKQEGSAQPHIYPSHIMDIEIRNYPINLINKYNKTVTPFFYKIRGNFTQIQQLETLRNTLLPKLMSGVIRVEN